MNGWSWRGYAPVGGHWGAAVVEAGDPEDVLTVAELNERARILPGDEESDELCKSYIAAAIQQVERDTGYALPTQTLSVTYDLAPAPGETLLVPWPPLQAITAMQGFNANGDLVPIDIEDPQQIRYIDFASMPARVLVGPAFNPGSAYGTWLTITAGWTKEQLPAQFKFAVGLAAAHFLTIGRDRVALGVSVAEMPAGYREAVDSLRLVELI